jgi:hypothetical protein
MRFQRSCLGPLLFFAINAVFFAASPSAAPLSDAVPELFTIHLTSGDSIRAVGLRPSSIDVVRVVGTDWTDRFIPTYRIQSVRDETGSDRTRDVIELRRSLGRVPTTIEPPRPPRPPHYGPKSVTKSFGISETGIFSRVGGDEDRKRSAGGMVDVGRGYNVGERMAVGGTLFIGGGDGYAEVGVRARMRYWLGAHSAIDFAPGIILAHEEPGMAEGDGPGLIGEIAWSPVRIVSLGVQAFSVRRSSVHFEGGPWYASVEEPGGRDTGIRFGLKLGGTPGLVSGVLAAALGLIGAGLQGTGTYAPGIP